MFRARVNARAFVRYERPRDRKTARVEAGGNPMDKIPPPA